eukprot:scaffold44372_cov58-Phaeocystis_antarctica.AAC.1
MASRRSHLPIPRPHLRRPAPLARPKRGAVQGEGGKGEGGKRGVRCMRRNTGGACWEWRVHGVCMACARRVHGSAPGAAQGR